MTLKTTLWLICEKIFFLTFAWVLNYPILFVTLWIFCCINRKFKNHWNFLKNPLIQTFHFFLISGGDLTFRIVTSILIELAIVFFTIILSILDSSSWPITFFYTTVISVTIVYMATGVYHNSIFGLSAHLPMIYTNAIVIGSNTSGTLTSIINIISIVISPNLKVAAVFYFSFAFFILLISLISYLLLPFNVSQLQQKAKFYFNSSDLVPLLQYFRNFINIGTM